MPLRFTGLPASNSAANEWCAMMTGVASSNPRAAENAAICDFMGLPPNSTHSAETSPRSLWELRPELSMTAVLQLIQLPLQRLVVRIELDGLLEVLDLIVLVVLLPVRLRHRDIGRHVARIELRVGLQERQSLVRLVGVGEV